jgi:hypothetical protein
MVMYTAKKTWDGVSGCHIPPRRNRRCSPKAKVDRDLNLRLLCDGSIHIVIPPSPVCNLQPLQPLQQLRAPGPRVGTRIVCLCLMMRALGWLAKWLKTGAMNLTERSDGESDLGLQTVVSPIK